MNDIRSALEDSLSAGFRDETMAKLKKQVKDMFADAESDLEYWIKADIASNLARFAESMAEDAIKAILNGDEDQMRRYLSCKEGMYTGRDREHTVIHGKLFETGAIELRKQIVNAFPELLKNERILDLEDQLRSVASQLLKSQSYVQELERRVMEYL